MDKEIKVTISIIETIEIIEEVQKTSEKNMMINKNK